MCLVIFAHGVSPSHPLMVAANRDEFHARATDPSGFWQQHPQLLAGRDGELGGTWMGITRSGRFAAVTNFRDPNAAGGPAPRSRGELPLDFLLGATQAGPYLDELHLKAGEYAGFNLLVGDIEGMWYYSNSGGKANQPQRLVPGIYGLSNASLDTPWPKIESGKQALVDLLAAGPPDHDSLLNVVNSPTLADPATLTALGLETGMEHLLSAQFIRSEVYGTRSTTTCWFDTQQAHWRELRFDPAGEVTGITQETFMLAAG